MGASHLPRRPRSHQGVLPDPLQPRTGPSGVPRGLRCRGAAQLPAGAGAAGSGAVRAGGLCPAQASLRPTDSYLHRSGLAPSPAAGCSPRRRSGAGGSCALSCSSLGRTSAWWGAATAGAAALPLQKPGTAAASVTPDSPAGRRRGGDLRGGAEPAGEGRGRRPGGAARGGRRARWRRAGGSGRRPRPRSPRSPPPPSRSAATQPPAARGQRCPPPSPGYPWCRPGHGPADRRPDGERCPARRRRDAGPTAAARLRGTGPSSGRAPFLGRAGPEGAGGAVMCTPVPPRERGRTRRSGRTAPPCLRPRRQPRQQRRQLNAPRNVLSLPATQNGLDGAGLPTRRAGESLETRQPKPDA